MCGIENKDILFFLSFPGLKDANRLPSRVMDQPLRMLTVHPRVLTNIEWSSPDADLQAESAYITD